MIPNKRSYVVALIVCTLWLAKQNELHADVMALGPGQTSLEFVPVVDPGNSADARVMNDGTSGYGSTPVSFRIAKFEVTAAQYAEFLNAVAADDTYGLYSNFMTNAWGCQIQQQGVAGSFTYTVSPEYVNRPVNNVNFWDAARFANWLHNGQPKGLQTTATTENGAYTLNGYMGGDGRTIERNADARYWIPNENEWYKAAFYKGGGTDAGYFAYPTQSDAPPISEAPPGSSGPSGSANYYDSAYVDSRWTTPVGEYATSPSPSGTFDQGGNVWEWNETLVVDQMRGLRGGGWNTFYDGSAPLNAAFRHREDPLLENPDIGFRVATAVPESVGVAACAAGLTSFVMYRKWIMNQRVAQIL